MGTWKPIRHGTENGYNQHRRRGQEACDSCKKAKSEYSWARHKENMERKGTPIKSLPNRTRKPVSTVQMPIKLFAALYWTADAHTLAALDAHFGEKRIDTLIKKSEEEE